MAIRRSRPASALGTNQPGARQSDLRERNLSLVLRQVLACAEPPSRADVSALTGLTRSTVSRLVDELIGGGLLTELSAAGTGRAGRPALPLVASSGVLCTLGLELNVERLSAYLLDITGEVIDSRTIAEDVSGSEPDVTLGRLVELARELLSPDAPRLAGIAVAVPGIVDADSGVLLRAPNLGWSKVAVSDFVRAALKPGDEVTIRLGNEADFSASTIAYTRPGAPSGMGDFLYVTGETGIGSAAVSDAGLVGGRHGWAGELGHVCVDPSGPKCACGARGCLETYAGTRALLAASGHETVEELMRAATDGDELTVGCLTRAGSALGVAVSAALNLLDLPLVVISGHLGRLATWVLPPMQEELRERVLAHQFSPPDIEVDTAPSPAGLGAALLSFKPILANPVEWLED